MKLNSTPLLTILLLAINIGVFIAQIISGISPVSPSNIDLIRWGANLAPLTLTGESWRLVSSMFLHVGIVHLLFNMSVLLAWGPSAERYFGKFGFAVLYLFTGIASGLLSAVWHGYHKVSSMQLLAGQIIQTTQPDLIVSAGASGALMGIAGAFLAAKLFGHPDEVDALQRVGGKNLAVVVAINLAYGFAGSGIDNAAHIGGLIAGFVLGIVFVWSFGRGNTIQYCVKAVLAALAVVLGIQGPAAFASDDLRELKTQLVEEIAAQKQNDQAEHEQREVERQTQLAEQHRAQEKQAVEQQAQRDEQQRPPSVSQAEAEGVQISVGDWPLAFTLSANGKHLYTANSGSNTVSVIDLASKTVLKTIGDKPLTGKHKRCKADNISCREVGAAGIAVSPDETIAYVADMRQDALSVVDLRTDTVIGEIGTGHSPSDIVLSSDGKFAYVLNDVDRMVAVIDTAARKHIATLELGQQDLVSLPLERPPTLALSADNQRLFVSNRWQNALDVFDTATRRLLKQIPFDAANKVQGIKLDAAGKKLWALDTHTISIYDAATLALEKKLPFCSPEPFWVDGFDINTDGSLIALTQNEEKQTLLLSPATRKVIGVLPAEHRSVAIRFVPNSQTFLVLNLETSKVSLQDATKTMATSEAAARNLNSQRNEILCWQ
ncbi:rhomboid family intramembrane serine protease [Andreprevotia chitinilytica]|uniref:rhomboid family intramembrane serine protease n=1 Tax=Andreprevotia chitinilytica TaxID=396808 RepID=UPI00055697F7|nr:rhomboid family intramembrane serine protease [Andreprevotia chitinilytica]